MLKKGDLIVIFGPGETKKRFSNFIQKSQNFQKFKFKLLKGLILVEKMEFTYLQNPKQ